MLRVFLVSSHLSAVFQALYAKKTFEPGFTDVLVIDDYFKKETLVESIKQTQNIHKWHQIIDFSTRLQDDVSLKPNLRKRVLRKIKHLPVLSSFYKGMYNRHEKKRAQKSRAKIEDVFKKNAILIEQKTELFLLTQTALNSGLMLVFPTAGINYMEHGTGDYFYVSKLKSSFDNFYCIFNDTFKKYLSERRNSNSDKVKPYLDKEGFEVGFNTIGFNPDSVQRIDSKRKHVLVLLDAFECYNPPVSFWIDFVDRCLKEIENKDEFVFLFKPHPNQSNESIEITYNYIKSLRINSVFLNAKGEASIAVESLFVMYPDAISHIFTTFSSAVFYIAKYYPEKASFYVLYDFVEKYTRSAPKQYLEIFHGLNEMITEVFDEGKIIRLK